MTRRSSVIYYRVAVVALSLALLLTWGYGIFVITSIGTLRMGKEGKSATHSMQITLFDPGKREAFIGALSEFSRKNNFELNVGNRDEEGKLIMISMDRPDCQISSMDPWNTTGFETYVYANGEGRDARKAADYFASALQQFIAHRDFATLKVNY